LPSPHLLAPRLLLRAQSAQGRGTLDELHLARMQHLRAVHRPRRASGRPLGSSGGQSSGQSTCGPHTGPKPPAMATGSYS